MRLARLRRPYEIYNRASNTWLVIPAGTMALCGPEKDGPPGYRQYKEFYMSLPGVPYPISAVSSMVDFLDEINLDAPEEV